MSTQDNRRPLESEAATDGDLDGSGLNDSGSPQPKSRGRRVLGFIGGALLESVIHQ